ncbi:hypothetical protein THERMOS_1839 [Bathymodiolus thermophilus thioautotrophic gill symbiont]|uniref:Uncharacterized protein n=1 Tax=Bathymodiolus thermophilus thioautotrophic gill symbiont TaxID=2360 RepID=A0A8H8XDJ1_9GAMM|nr:hypothetical protein THERMOS_1839 [Bathymodiolus thermophilus thioautotrophic gill symbiont]
MAVNLADYNDDNLFIFLSRLCGGEFITPVIRFSVLFLSRLCGGE